MTICLDDLGDGFITFPEFQRQLRDYERQQDARVAAVTASAGCSNTFTTALNTTGANLIVSAFYDSADAVHHIAYDVAGYLPVATTRCHHGVPSTYTCQACVAERAE